MIMIKILGKVTRKKVTNIKIMINIKIHKGILYQF